MGIARVAQARQCGFIFSCVIGAFYCEGEGIENECVVLETNKMSFLGTLSFASFLRAPFGLLETPSKNIFQPRVQSH